METDTAPEESNRQTGVEEPPRNGDSLTLSDLDMDTDSQGSVSMLQGCYEEEADQGFPELTETCLNSKLEMIEEGGDSEEEEETRRTDTETQTDFSIFSPRPEVDKILANHASFIGCVVKLKFVLSSRKNIPSGRVTDILRNLPEGVREGGEGTVSSETIGYVLRSANLDRVFRETVEALVLHLEEELEKDLDGIARHWRNSVHEMAVGMVNQAVDAEPGLRRGVDSFLGRLVGSILTPTPKRKNLALESKSAFIVNFCQSTYLTYAAIDHLIGRVKSLKSAKQPGECSAREEKLTRGRLTRNSYFLLRVLEALLESFRSKLERDGAEEVLPGTPEEPNVLEMWRKHWRQPGREREENGRELVRTLSRWCDDLDDVLLHFVRHLPVSSMAVGRCANLAKQVLRVSRPGEGSL